MPLRSRFGRLVAVAFMSLAPCASAAAGDREDERAHGGRGPSEKLPAYEATTEVTASRTEQRVSESPSAVTVLDAERIRNAAIDTYADLLRMVPGMNVIATSARDVSCTMRGATSTVASSQLVFVDGRSVYQDFQGFVPWDTIPIELDDVQQVEVVRGPASAMWGANAMHGVINIRTRHPAEMQGGELRLGAGERSTFLSSVRWADVSGPWSYKLSGGYYRQGQAWQRDTTLPDGDPLPPGAEFENEGTRQGRLDVVVEHGSQARGVWTLGGGLGISGGILHSPQGPFRIHFPSGLYHGRVTYQRGALEASGYVNVTDGLATSLFSGTTSDFDTNTYVGDLVNRTALGASQVLVYGVSLRANRFHITVAPRGDSRNDAGGFLEDQVTLGKHVRLSLGGRLDWSSTIGVTASPRASLLLLPNPDHSVRFSFGRAYRAPTLFETFLDSSSPNQVVLPSGPFVFETALRGSEDLEPETLTALELGYTATIRQRATLTASVYRNRTEDLIHFLPAAFYGPDNLPPGWPLPPSAFPAFTFPSLLAFRNLGTVVDKGLELTADLLLARGFRLSGQYTLQAEPAVSDRDPMLPFPVNLPPRHQFGMRLQGSVGRWFGSAAWSHTGRAFWADVLDPRFWGFTEAYDLVDGVFGVRLGGGRLELSLSGTNLLDEKAKQHAFGDIIRRKVIGELRAGF